METMERKERKRERERGEAKVRERERVRLLFQVIQVAESMLRTATQTSSLAMAKIDAGWMLFHALVSLGMF